MGEPIMSRCLPWPWLTAGLLVLGGGCQNVDPNLPTTHLTQGPIHPAAPASELPGGEIPTSYRVRPAVSAAVFMGTPPDVLPVRHQDVPVLGARVGAVQWQSPDSAKQNVNLERPLPRYARPVVITPARPICAHAADYRWLVGYLRCDSVHRRWQIRYAEEDENDRYGGVIELVNPGPMSGFHPGQLVRVEGDLVDPAPLEIIPAYRVVSLQALRR
jgi:hypothetical protein